MSQDDRLRQDGMWPLLTQFPTPTTPSSSMLSVVQLEDMASQGEHGLSIVLDDGMLVIGWNDLANLLLPALEHLAGPQPRTAHHAHHHSAPAGFARTSLPGYDDYRHHDYAAMDQDDSGSSRRGSAASSSVRFERSGAVSPSSAATPAEDRADWPLGGGARRPSAFGPLRQARSTDWSSRRTSNAGLDRKNASSLAFAERRKSIPHFPYPFGAQQQQPPTPLSSAPSPRETAHRASFDHQQAPPPPASESPRIATFSLPRWRGNSRKTDLHTERATERLEVILDDDSGKVHWAGSPAGQACATGRHITFEPAQHVRVFEAGIEVFAWTASGNSWLKGQIKSTPGCLCGFSFTKGGSVDGNVFKRPSVIREHIGTCPRILEDDPLAILCRFAREGDRLNTSLRGARKRQNASTGSDRPASPSTSA